MFDYLGTVFAYSLLMKLKRKILLSLLATIIIGYGIVTNERNPKNLHSASSHYQFQTIQLNSSTYSYFQKPQGIPKLNREEILRKNLKGYREQTYWGNEHPIDEKMRDLNDKEFNDFVEDEIKSKDADVYWGAEY